MGGWVGEDTRAQWSAPEGFMVGEEGILGGRMGHASYGHPSEPGRPVQ